MVFTKELNDIEDKLKNEGYSISAIKLIDQGVESYIFSGYCNDLKKELVIKKPKESIYNNGNDNDLPAYKLLQQDFNIYSYLKSEDFLCVPEPILFIKDKENPLLIMERVEQVKTINYSFNQNEINETLSKLHDLNPPNFSLVAMEGFKKENTVISKRIRKRLKNLNTIINKDFYIPIEESLLKVLECGPINKKSLLHMDLRPENILINKSNKIKLIDWSNALIGDPLLEFSRKSEYEYLANIRLTNNFYDGDTLKEAIYRLDTAIMLAIVFLSQVPNNLYAKHQINRVTSLLKTLTRGDI